ncbi:hypothetical protein [Andreprevotia sp. IGB-42]|nr:hypothetical protein [Andreprevotia sp. IGB-42]
METAASTALARWGFALWLAYLLAALAVLAWQDALLGLICGTR